jgi:hypothetical protein
MVQSSKRGKMLPDLPKYKSDIQSKILTKIVRQVQKQDPLMGQIDRFMQHEGDVHAYSTVQGKEKKSGYQTVGEEFKVSIDDVRSGDFNRIVERVLVVGKKINDDMAKSMFRTVEEATQEVGNVVKGEFSVETFFAAIEKIEMDFDKQTGQPKFPSMYVHPSNSEKIKETLTNAESNPLYKKKFSQLIEKKRKEWNDREATRKLVD